jgi:hypothetical protein
MKLSKAFALVLGLAAGVAGYALMSTSATAATCDPNSTVMTRACELQQIAARLPEVTGTKRITTSGVVCLTVWANRPTALVLAEGRVKEGEPVDGRVITSWRTQPSMWTSHPNGGVVREICIPAALLQGTVTLCNEENRSIWSAEDVAYLKRVKRIPAKDPACLLGKEECKKFGL